MTPSKAIFIINYSHTSSAFVILFHHHNHNIDFQLGTLLIMKKYKVRKFNKGEGIKRLIDGLVLPIFSIKHKADAIYLLADDFVFIN